MNSTFELWVKGCEINGTKLYCLEGKDGTALYQLVGEYEYKYNIFRNVSYQVWEKGKCICVTTNSIAAYQVWDNVKNRHTLFKK